MHETYDLINLSNKTPINFSLVHFDHIPKHTHACIEVIIVLEGKVDYEIEFTNYVASENDMVIINPFSLHELRSITKDATVLSLKIEYTSMVDEISEVENLKLNLNTMRDGQTKLTNDVAYLIYSLIYFNTKENINSTFTNRAIAYSLFAKLMNDFKETDNHKRNLKSNDVIWQINEYISSHYKDNISLSSLASHFNFAESYLSRLIKQNFGKTFIDYYDSLRINNSIYQLSNTSQSIDEIASNYGFSSARSYVRAFKKIMNIYPSEYRNRDASLNRVIENVPNDNFRKKYLNKIIQNYNNLKRSSESDVDQSRNSTQVIEASISKYSKLSKSYNKILYFKNAAALLSKQCLLEIQKIVKTNKYEYLLLDNLDNDFLGTFQENEYTSDFNFFLIENIINTIKEANINVIFRFSLSNEVTNRLLVFLNYIEKRYGHELLLKIAFSPKISKNRSELKKVYKKELFNEYLNMYKTIKNFEKNIPITAFLITKTDVLSTNIFEEFLEFEKNNNLDIFYYPILFKDDYRKTSKLEKNPAELKDFFNFLKNNNILIPDKISLEGAYITSNLNLLNDTIFASNLLSKYYLDSINCFHSLVNISFFDYETGTNKDNYPFYGSPGLINNNFIRKSSYYALNFISKLEDNVISFKDNYIITYNGKNKITILVNNYNHYSKMYADNELYESTYTDRYKCFASSTKINMTFKLNDIKFSQANVRVSSINHESGSAYDLWVKSGASKDLSDDDIETIKKLSHPNFKIEKIAIEKYQLQFDILVKPLETSLIEINLIN